MAQNIILGGGTVYPVHYSGGGAAPALNGPWWTTTSFINTPIGASPTLDANNAAYISTLNGASNVTGTFCFPNGSTGSGSTTVYHATQAIATAHHITVSSAFHGNVTFPYVSTWVIDTTDGHIAIIMDEAITVGSNTYSKGDLIEFQSLDASALTCHDWEVFNVLTQNGSSHLGTFGDGIGMLGIALGLILPADVAAVNAGTIDHIPHALRFSLPNAVTGTNARFPAVHSDGSGSNTTCPPSGALLQLDPTLALGPFGLNTWGTMIAKTLQIFGCYVGDCTGTSSAPVYLEDTSDGSSYAITPSQLTGTLVSHLRVIASSSVPGS